MSITVATMGVYFRWEFPEALRRQLRLVHDLREDLVSAQLAYEEAIKEVWSSYPTVAAAEEDLAAAQQRADGAADVVKQARTKRVSGPPADALRTARAEVKAARQRRRDAIRMVIDDADTRLRVLADQLKATHKQLYGEYCQSGDLYWASFNTVLDHHKTAVKQIGRRRKSGQPAQLRHHRFDGTGTIAVQLQRQAGAPARTPPVIADAAGKYRNVLQVPWIDPTVLDVLPRSERRRRLHGTVRMRCGALNGEPQWIDIPVLQHRMLPADADIVGAQLTVTRVANQLRTTIAVTAKTVEAQPIVGEDDEHPVVAVRLGWRDSDDHTVVAHWRATSPISTPDHLRHLITAAPDGLTGTIMLPHNVASQSGSADDLASTRDLSFEGLRDKVATWISERDEPIPHPGRDGETLTAADVRRWRSPGRLIHLANAWSNNAPAATPDGVSEIVEAINEWRRADIPLWRRQAFSRRKALNRRRDYYRTVAAHFTAQVGRIVVDDMSIADIARHASANEDLPADIAHKIARRRAVSAPGQLRECLTAAATRDHIPVTVVPATGLARIHPRCGHENPADGRYIHATVLCDGCGAKYTPAVAATITMLTRAVTAPKPTK